MLIRGDTEYAQGGRVPPIQGSGRRIWGISDTPKGCVAAAFCLQSRRERQFANHDVWVLACMKGRRLVFACYDFPNWSKPQGRGNLRFAAIASVSCGIGGLHDYRIQGNASEC